MEQRKAGQCSKSPQQHVAAFVAHDAAHRYRLQLTLLEQFRVRLPHHQAQACKQGHHVHRKGHKKRIAPAPGQKLLHREAAVQVGKQAGSQHKTERCAQLADHGVPAPALLGGRHGQQRRQAVPRPAQCEPLAHTQDQQGHDGGGARILVARQKRHAHGADAQHEQRNGQLGAPPPAPLDGHGDGGTHRAHHERNGQQRKGHQRAVQAGHKGKQEGWEDKNAGDPENEEVEILGRASDDHAHSDFAGGDVLMRISPRERGGAFVKTGRRVSGSGGAAHEHGSLTLCS